MKAGRAYKQEKGKSLNERRNCTWKCESGGKPDARIRPSSRVLNGVSGKGVKMANRKTKNVGCPVMLHAKVTKDGKWQIRNVVLQHQNHEPVPSISKYISMFHRDDLNAVRKRLFQHHDEGISIPQIHSALAAERNGVENFPVSERQLRNVVDKERRLKMMEVNHHGQSVLLGCALISHEDAETFEWVFTNWISCMGGKPPSGILTDQDAAMKKAIAKVMPNTRHRWCLWHISSTSYRKLGGYDKYEEIKQALLRAIYDSYIVEEFENCWNEAIDTYNLGDNAWLKVDNDTFIKTAVNVYELNYLKKQTRLYEFVQHNCKAMERRAEDEKQTDADSARFCHQLVSDFPIERVFQKIYTSAKFLEVQQEWIPNSRKDIPTRRKREYEVKYNSNNYEAWVCLQIDGVFRNYMTSYYRGV
ncbi:Protein FAR1-RELATED SEQUENCE 5 [Bienertia sinuspersici]